MKHAGIGAGLLHVFGNGHHAVVGAEGEDVISAAYFCVQMNEQVSEVFVELHQDVLHFPTARPESVSRIIQRGICDSQKIRAFAFSEAELVHSQLSELRQISIGKRASLPLLVKSGIRIATGGFAAQRMRKGMIPSVGWHSTNSFLGV